MYLRSREGILPAENAMCPCSLDLSCFTAQTIFAKRKGYVVEYPGHVSLRQEIVNRLEYKAIE